MCNIIYTIVITCIIAKISEIRCYKVSLFGREDPNYVYESFHLVQKQTDWARLAERVKLSDKDRGGMEEEDATSPPQIPPPPGLASLAHLSISRSMRSMWTLPAMKRGARD